MPNTPSADSTRRSPGHRIQSARSSVLALQFGAQVFPANAARRIALELIDSPLQFREELRIGPPIQVERRCSLGITILGVLGNTEPQFIDELKTLIDG